MADQVTITFSGMCAFQVVGDSGVAVMPSEGGAHRPALVLPTDFIDARFTTWKPDLLGDIEVQVAGASSAFIQVGIWNLKGLTLTASDDAPAAVSWPDRSDMIDFAVYHPGATTLSVGDIQTRDPIGCVFAFKGGALSSAKTSIATISQEHRSDTDRSVVAKVRWIARVGSITNSANQMIQFSGPTAGWISNLAPISADEGATHVKNYYDMLTVPPGTDRLTKVADRDTTVFDCIRPSSVP